MTERRQCKARDAGAYEPCHAAAHGPPIRHLRTRAISVVVEVALRETDERESADGRRNEPGRGVRDSGTTLLINIKAFRTAGLHRVQRRVHRRGLVVSYVY